ncbi:MAG: S9 family peptidase [Asticcacaulis sp.]
MTTHQRSILTALSLALMASAAPAALAQSAAGGMPLTPERVFNNPSLTGPAASGVKLSPDGTLVTYLKAKESNAQVLDLWAADVKGGAPFRLIDARALAPEDKDLSEAEKARRERMRISVRGVVDYAWDDKGQFILVPLDGDVWLFERASQKVRRLTETPGDEIDARVSPASRYVSYVRDQNLYVRDLASGTETALTTDGKDVISYGVAEFIAQEEMDRDVGYWWSADDRQIVYARVDETPVDIVPRLDISAEGSKTVLQRYPRAGRPNAIVELFVHDMASGRKVQLDLGTEKDIYVARVNWSRDGKTVYVQRQNRAQTRLDLMAFDPATGKGKVLLSQTSDAWVELTHDFRPLADGSFLWSSEADGNRHIYHHASDGRVIRQVTKGDWMVRGIAGLNEKAGLVLFSSGMNDPTENALFAVSYKKADKPKALTSTDGWWGATVNKTGTAFAGTYSDPKTPPRTGLFDANGKLVRWIEENKLDDKHPYAPYLAGHPTKDFGTLKARDGQTMHYSLEKPANFDPSKRYPVIVYVYGGPGVQRVTKGWSSPSNRLWLDAGYLIFTLDNRGSSGRSVAFKTAIHKQLGKVETIDQLDGAAFLKTLPYVDANRLGVMGWSYGGFMTMMLLTEPNTPFKAGSGGAAPTHWGLYDTHYTERFMQTPQQNPTGYATWDINARLDHLKPNSLMLIHGMADDNVIFENATRTIGAIQAKSIPFETMLYPGERHGVRGNAKGLHRFRTELDFFNRRLKGE